MGHGNFTILLGKLNKKTACKVYFKSILLKISIAQDFQYQNSSWTVVIILIMVCYIYMILSTVEVYQQNIIVLIYYYKSLYTKLIFGIWFYIIGLYKLYIIIL